MILGRVRGPIHGRVRGPIHGRVRGPIHGRVREPIHGRVRGLIHGRVRGRPLVGGQGANPRGLWGSNSREGQGADPLDDLNLEHVQGRPFRLWRSTGLKGVFGGQGDPEPSGPEHQV